MNKIRKLKQERNVTTSEELFNINKPPDYQCVYINKIIEVVTIIQNEATINEDDDYEKLKDKVENIAWEISTVGLDIECLRRVIEQLRIWGMQWKDLSKEMVDKCEIDIDKLNKR